MADDNEEGPSLTIEQKILAASGASFISVLLTNPLDVVKTRLQLSQSHIANEASKINRSSWFKRECDRIKSSISSSSFKTSPIPYSFLSNIPSFSSVQHPSSDRVKSLSRPPCSASLLSVGNSISSNFSKLVRFQFFSRPHPAFGDRGSLTRVHSPFGSTTLGPCASSSPLSQGTCYQGPLVSPSNVVSGGSNLAKTIGVVHVHNPGSAVTVHVHPASLSASSCTCMTLRRSAQVLAASPLSSTLKYCAYEKVSPAALKAKAVAAAAVASGSLRSIDSYSSLLVSRLNDTSLSVSSRAAATLRRSGSAPSSNSNSNSNNISINSSISNTLHNNLSHQSLSSSPSSARTSVAATVARTALPEKTASSTSSQAQRQGAIAMFREIVNKEGARVLWRGVPVSLASSVPMVAIYMPLYDHLLSDVFRPLLSTSFASPPNVATTENETSSGNGSVAVLPALAPILAGTMARTISVFVVAPLDLIRTAQQGSSGSSGSSISLKSLFFPSAPIPLSPSPSLQTAPSSVGGASPSPPTPQTPTLRTPRSVGSLASIHALQGLDSRAGPFAAVFGRGPMAFCPSSQVLRPSAVVSASPSTVASAAPLTSSLTKAASDDLCFTRRLKSVVKCSSLPSSSSPISSPISLPSPVPPSSHPFSHPSSSCLSSTLTAAKSPKVLRGFLNSPFVNFLESFDERCRLEKPWRSLVSCSSSTSTSTSNRHSINSIVRSCCNNHKNSNNSDDSGSNGANCNSSSIHHDMKKLNSAAVHTLTTTGATNTPINDYNNNRNSILSHSRHVLRHDNSNATTAAARALRALPPSAFIWNMPWIPTLTGGVGSVSRHGMKPIPSSALTSSASPIHRPCNPALSSSPVLSSSLTLSPSSIVASTPSLVSTPPSTTSTASTSASTATKNVRACQIKTMWTGVGATLARDVPFSAIYWALLETGKSAMTSRILQAKSQHPQQQLLQPPLPSPVQHPLQTPQEPLSLSKLEPSFTQLNRQELITVNCLAGAVAGVVAAATTTPLDVVKTRIQMAAVKSRAGQSFLGFEGLIGSEKGVWITMRSIAVEEGWSALFRGALPRMTRAAPACAIVITSYELFKDMFVRSPLIAKG